MDPQSKEMQKIYTYFGWIEVVNCENGKRQTKVRINDNFSSKSTEFTLPTNIVHVGATEQCVLLIGGNEDGPVWLYHLRNEVLYQYSISPSTNDDDDPKNPIFMPCQAIPIQINPMLPKTSTTLARLEAQFSHWTDFKLRGWEEKIAAAENVEPIPSNVLLACTAFGAFLVVQNVGVDDGNVNVVLQCLFQHESPLLSTDPNQPSTSGVGNLEEMPKPEKNVKSMLMSSSRKHFTKGLPFNVKKLCAGQDHLVLLTWKGHVFTMGTGTKGELGHGQVEQGQWEEPKLVEALAEAGIRIVDIECGAWHTVAMTDEGDLYGWGWNGHGQLGHPPEHISIQPMPHPFEQDQVENCYFLIFLFQVKLLHCAGNSTLLLLSNGKRCVFGELATSGDGNAEKGSKMADTSDSNIVEQQVAGIETAEATKTTAEKPAEQPPPKFNFFSTPRKEMGETAKAEIKTGKNERGQTEHEEMPSAPKRPRQQRRLHLAVAGCSHGQMDTIYERLQQVEQQRNIKFDLLICCGDFQAIRNHGDLHYYHAPPQHRKLGTFYKYYNGERVAPVLTLFVGGNHESSAYMAELPYGGWVAPNIYFMGYASVVQFAGLRIAGLSGIYKEHDYKRGHFERPPFQKPHPKIDPVVTAYHVRELEVFRLRQLRDTQVDICISHDWPVGITKFGDQAWLLRTKPYFAEDIHHNRLGNPATMNLLYQLKPHHWFAAHMHVRFTAVVPHTPDGEATPDSPVTRFLALDKPQQGDTRRRYLEFMELSIGEDAPMELSYDPHWLAVLRGTDSLMEFTDRRVHMPGEMPGVEGAHQHDFRPSATDLEAVHTAFGGDFRIPLNFQRTAPPELEPWAGRGRPASLYYRNPQTSQFCERLGIRDLNLLFAQASVNHLGIPHYIVEQQQAAAANGNADGAANNPEEIDLGDEFGDEDFIVDVAPSTSSAPTLNE